MRIALGLAVCLILSMPVQADPVHYPVGEWREHHRDWLAACPDTIDEDAADYSGYSCFAATTSEGHAGADVPTVTLTLIRNRLDGALDLAVKFADDETQYDTTRPLVLRFPGEVPLSLALGTGIETRFDLTNEFFILNDTLEAEIIAQMKRHPSLTLQVPVMGTIKPVEIQLSLHGVLSSLDFMDIYARKVASY